MRVCSKGGRTNPGEAFMCARFPGGALIKLCVASIIAWAVGGGAACADTKDNILRVGIAAEPYTLDPAMGLSGNDYPYLYTIFERLLTFDLKTLEPRPGL